MPAKWGRATDDVPDEKSNEPEPSYDDVTETSLSLDVPHGRGPGTGTTVLGGSTQQEDENR